MKKVFTSSAVLLAAVMQSSVAFAQLDIPSEMTIIGPCRLLDTSLPGQGPGFLDNETRNVDVRGRCGIPQEATGIAFNLIVIAAPAAGQLRVFRADGPLAPTVALLYAAGANIGNMAISALRTLPPTDPNQDIKVFADFNGAPAGTRIRVVLDVMGYFHEETAPIAPLASATLPVTEKVESGDLVMADRNERGTFRLADSSAERGVFGVVLRTSDSDFDLATGLRRARIAMGGSVRLKVDASRGPIHAGDALTISIQRPGHAMAADDGTDQLIIGTALESLQMGSGRIRALLRSN